MTEKFSSYSSKEDSALFLLVKQRDKEAFGAIYRKYHPYLYAISLRYLKNEGMAEDAVQHVFVKFWEVTRNVSIEVNLKNYLYTMVKNHILNLFRDRKEVLSLHYMNAQLEPADEDDFLGDVEQNQLIELLREGVKSLPPQKQMICEMKMEESISNQEIADRMGLSLHTVKSHYQESIKMLRKYFQKIKMILF